MRFTLLCLGVTLLLSCGELAGPVSFSNLSEEASSSSSEGISSSSSEGISSSSNEEISSSSSEEILSSSSEEISSSSSEEISSSSSEEMSSSSSEEMSSSSSEEMSSSSSEEILLSSSSSIVPCTANNNNSKYYCSNGVMKEYGFVTHNDGQTYRTIVIGETQIAAIYKTLKTVATETQASVAIGTQTWMAENLNYNAPNSRCYSNASANCNKYGRLYDWATAMNLPSNCNTNPCTNQLQPKHQGICPSGWHIPSNDDWNTLMDYVGGASTAGKVLKAKSGWQNNGNGTDQHGFSALPGGYGHSIGTSENAGALGRWWSTRQDNGGSNAYVRSIHYDRENALIQGYEKSILYSVRCVKD